MENILGWPSPLHGLPGLMMINELLAVCNSKCLGGVVNRGMIIRVINGFDMYVLSIIDDQ